MSPRRWALVVLSFAFALGVSVYVVWSGWGSAGAPPLLPWWAHLLALGSVALEILARSLKIRWSAAALGIPVRITTAARVILGGDFAAGITPGRSGTEPARFLVFAEAGVPVASILLILFTELVLEFLSMIILVIGLALAFPGSGGVLALTLGVVGTYAVFVVSAAGGGLYLSRRNANGPPPGWARRIGLHAGRWRRVQKALRSLRSSIAAFRGARPGPLVAGTMISVVHLACRVALLAILVRSVAPDTPIGPLVLWSLVLLNGTALAPAPGGGGAVEFSFKFALGGLLAADVLGGSLVWWRFYSFYLYILLGGLAAGGTALRALRERPDQLIAEAKPG